jgi:hypothetical protein
MPKQSGESRQGFQRYVRTTVEKLLMCPGTNNSEERHLQDLSVKIAVRPQNQSQRSTFM